MSDRLLPSEVALCVRPHLTSDTLLPNLRKLTKGTPYSDTVGSLSCNNSSNYIKWAVITTFTPFYEDVFPKRTGGCLIRPDRLGAGGSSHGAWCEGGFEAAL